MSKYYGIDIQSPNVVRYGSIPDMSLRNEDSKIAWFSTEKAAIQYAEDEFHQRMEQREALPELFEHEISKLPGIAFLYMEDSVPSLMKASHINGCCGVGGIQGYKSASFVYCPPPGFNSAQSQDAHRDFLYYAGFHGDQIRHIIDTYDKDFEIVMPAGYQPQLMPTDASKQPTIYVHYGNTQFDAARFQPPCTCGYDLKPQAGFWASDTHANLSWHKWCQREGYKQYHPNNRMEFTLKQGAKVFMVRTLNDIEYLLKTYPAPFTSALGTYGTYVERGLPCLAVDFEAMSKDYDGIDFDCSQLGNIMGTWDCDSACIFNPDVMRFREIELMPVDPEYTQDEFDDIEEEL